MAVRRIVANIAAEQVAAGEAFYGGVLTMRVVMDLGWIVTFAAEGAAAPQVSVAREGGSGTSVPDLSIEVDDLRDCPKIGAQVGSHAMLRPACRTCNGRCHVKDWRPHRIATRAPS
jgi:hypothetical protein